VGAPETSMSESECKRCGEPTESPGYAVPLLAVLLLFLVGGTKKPFARTGYCSACARFATLITVVACGVLVITAIIISIVLS
jgi:hypothetical protein